MTENEIAKIVVNLSYKIHRLFGPGLFESVYEELLCYELTKLNISFTRQQPVPLVHETVKLEVGFRADIIVERKVIVEIKSKETLADVHFKQVHTYLQLTNIKLGLLINFNVALIRDGIRRIVNKL